MNILSTRMAVIATSRRSRPRPIAWSGWFAYDVFTRKGDPAEALEKTFEIMDLFEKLLDKFGMDELGEMIAQGDPAPTFATLIRKLV